MYIVYMHLFLYTKGYASYNGQTNFIFRIHAQHKYKGILVSVRRMGCNHISDRGNDRKGGGGTTAAT